MNALLDAVGEPPDLKLIRGMAEKAEQLARNIQDLEATLKAQRDALEAITFNALPAAMDAAGLKKLDLRDGTTIAVENQVRGSLPKEPDRKAEALIYLDKIGGSELIKSDVVIPFPKKQHNEALALADDLRQQGYAVTVEAGVHHMTLGAFVRDRMAHGEAVNPDALGISINRVAKVSLAKREGDRG